MDVNHLGQHYHSSLMYISLPVTGSQPQVLEGENSAVELPWMKKYKCLRVKAIRAYHHCALLSMIKPRKRRHDSPQPGLLPPIISLNAYEKIGL